MRLEQILEMAGLASNEDTDSGCGGYIDQCHMPRDEVERKTTATNDKEVRDIGTYEKIDEIFNSIFEFSASLNNDVRRL